MPIGRLKNFLLLSQTILTRSRFWLFYQTWNAGRGRTASFWPEPSCTSRNMPSTSASPCPEPIVTQGRVDSRRKKKSQESELSDRGKKIFSEVFRKYGPIRRCYIINACLSLVNIRKIAKK